MFHSPQIVLFSTDVERAATFDQGLGFVEVFRVPTAGRPIHIDLVLDGYRIGFASIDSSRYDHGLEPASEEQRAAVVLWTDDVARDHAALVTQGCRDLGAPHLWLDTLRIAWVADPDGHPIQLVTGMTQEQPRRRRRHPTAGPSTISTTAARRT